MELFPFFRLKEEAQREAYAYFDLYIRKLPKRKSGVINELAPGLEDNDVDAFRHAYVSGVFTQEYGEKAANFFGLSYEYSLKLENELDDLLLANKIDLSLRHQIESQDLLDHIQRVGKTFYSQGSSEI